MTLNKKRLLESSQVKKTILENRLVRIQETLEINEADWVDRARNWLRGKYYGAHDTVKQAGRDALVNPEKIINDERQALMVVVKALETAKTQVKAFKQDALRSSTTINNLEEAVLDAFGKYITLVDNIPLKQRGILERNVMKLVSEFYIALMEEKMRIETYLSYLTKEIGSQGYNLGKSATEMAGYKPDNSSSQSEPSRQPSVSGNLVGAKT